MHFNYIYGIGVLGCLSMWALLSLMSAEGVTIGTVVTVLGYCLLPMVGLSGVNVVFSLQWVNIGTLHSRLFSLNAFDNNKFVCFQRLRGHSVDVCCHPLVQFISIQTLRYGACYGTSATTCSLSLCFVVWCICTHYYFLTFCVFMHLST